MKGDEGFAAVVELYVEAGVAGDGLEPGAGAYAAATVDDGPAGEINIVIFFQLHICIDGTSDNLLGIFKIVYIVQMNHDLAALRGAVENKERNLQSIESDEYRFLEIQCVQIDVAAQEQTSVGAERF